MALPRIDSEFLVTADPRTGHLPDGTPKLELLLGGQRKKKNEQTDSWDVVGQFSASMTLFGDKAMQYADVIDKLTVLVIYNSEMKIRTYQGNDGTSKMSVELDGTYATIGVVPPRIDTGQGGGQGQGQFQQNQGQQGQFQQGQNQGQQGQGQPQGQGQANDPFNQMGGAQQGAQQGGQFGAQQGQQGGQFQGQQNPWQGQQQGQQQGGPAF